MKQDNSARVVKQETSAMVMKQETSAMVMKHDNKARVTKQETRARVKQEKKGRAKQDVKEAREMKRLAPRVRHQTCQYMSLRGTPPLANLRFLPTIFSAPHFCCPPFYSGNPFISAGFSAGAHYRIFLFTFPRSCSYSFQRLAICRATRVYFNDFIQLTHFFLGNKFTSLFI